MKRIKERLQKIYRRLLKKHGPPRDQWQLWCKRPKTLKEKEKIIIEAVLTQRTNWQNVEKVIRSLERRKLISLKNLWQFGKKNRKEFFSLLKPIGFFRQKGTYLLELIEFILKRYQGIEKMSQVSLFKLRSELLSLKGIGKETADSILLYSLEKPIFVIDEYTRRLVKKEGLSSSINYDTLQKLFQDNLPQKITFYQDFHALIVIEGKNKNLD